VDIGGFAVHLTGECGQEHRQGKGIDTNSSSGSFAGSWCEVQEEHVIQAFTGEAVSSFSYTGLEAASCLPTSHSQKVAMAVGHTKHVLSTNEDSIVLRPF
jgi:hypothetical protein